MTIVESLATNVPVHQEQICVKQPLSTDYMMGKEKEHHSKSEVGPRSRPAHLFPYFLELAFE